MSDRIRTLHGSRGWHRSIPFSRGFPIPGKLRRQRTLSILVGKIYTDSLAYADWKKWGFWGLFCSVHPPGIRPVGLVTFFQSPYTARFV
jgi:hypothetical protein